MADILSRAASRAAEAPTQRVATVAVNRLRNEYGLNGANAVPPSVLVEMADQVFLLVRAGR